MRFEPIETLWTKKFKTGYTLKRQIFIYDGRQMEMTSAFNHQGDYIGNSRDAHFLCTKKGIKPQLAPGKTVCAIGFCAKEQKWYGWSHRAVVGFKIGDKIFEERFGNDHTPFSRHGKITIKNLTQAMKSAINFAEYIG